MHTGNMEFRISSDGHFYINTLTNNKRIRFMLDTGATDVVIPRRTAEILGFDLNKLKFTKIYNTANGQVRGAPITIKTMQIGNFNFNQ
jgi:aspartyl protease family protein